MDRNDARCGTRFRLGRIEQAFIVCFGGYHACPMYHRINRELSLQERAASRRDEPLIAVTAHGHQIALRPTGT